jgi:steroid delta-isomerase-like uncharacterized protein
VSQAGVGALADRFQAAWSDHSGDGFAATCAADLHYEDPLCETPLVGPAALAAHAQRMWTACPDARMQSTGERLTDGRFVAMPVKLLGTHSREILDFPPSGRSIVVHAVFYCELDAKRTRLWRIRAFFDLYDAAVQLGVLPRPGSLGERAMFLLRGFGLKR